MTFQFLCNPNECNTRIEVTCDEFGFPNGVVEMKCACGRVMERVGE
jgi:hypothetical protein